METLTAKQEDYILEEGRERYYDKKAEQKCEFCHRTEQECREGERGELKEHKVDGWDALICDECYGNIERSCD